jgi:hypothetical protein
MATFVTISEGDDAVDAHPLLVIDDPGVAHAVAVVIARRLGLGVPESRSTRSIVRAIRRADEPEGGAP